MRLLLSVVEQTVSGLAAVDGAVDAPADGRPTPELAPIDQPLAWSLFLVENPVPLETLDRLGGPLGSFASCLDK